MQLLIDNEPIELHIQDNLLVSEDSVLDLSEVRASLEFKGHYFVRLISQGRTLELAAETNQQLSDFYAQIQKLTIQTNFFELFRTDDGGCVFERKSGRRFMVLKLAQTLQNLHRIKVWRKLPACFIQIDQVFEELDHFYLILQDLPKIELQSEHDLFQIIHALSVLQKAGYSHCGLGDFYREGSRLRLGGLQHMEPVSEVRIASDFEALRRFSNSDLLGCADSWVTLVHQPVFLDRLGGEFVTWVLESQIKPAQTAQELIENNLQQIRSFQSIHSGLEDSPTSELTDAVFRYCRLSINQQHRAKQSSTQFVLESLLNEHLLQEDRYLYLQDQGDNLEQLGELLQKEIVGSALSPEEGSTCPNTVKMRPSKEIAQQRLNTILQQAQIIEESTQGSKQKQKITNIRRSLMDLQ